MIQARVLPPLVVVAAYVAVSAATLWIWSARGIYPLIGDEPHYLVIGDALWRFGGIDVMKAYESELLNRVFYPSGLGDQGAEIAQYGHVVPGETGVYSWHGYLLGWVAGLPAVLIGVEAARWAMVVLGAAICVTVWILSGNFFSTVKLRVVVCLALVLTYPFLLASIQVFPDFVAGGLVLVGLAWLMASKRIEANPTRWVTFGAAFLVSLLPWLGIKFAPVAGVVLVAMLVRCRSCRAAVVIPTVISALLLATFNSYTYGNPFGSLTGGTVEFGRDFWIRLAGMILDQSQGAVMFNPILWLGLLGLVPFLRRDRLVAAVWVGAFGLLWVLGAAHPGWYGGGSFIGRYSWGLALLLMIPTMETLAWIYRRSEAWFAVILAASIAFSAWVFALGVIVSDAGPGVPLGLDFYTKPQGTWLESYAVLWYPIHRLVSAWYAPSWVWTYWNNYVWVFVAVAVVFMGTRMTVGIRRPFVVAGLVLILAAAAVAGVLSKPGERDLVQLQGIQVQPGVDQAGVVAGGPVWLMREGPYVWSITYASALPPIDVVGRWELVRARNDEVVAAGELLGTNGRMREVTTRVGFRNLSPRQFFLRIIWNGGGSFEVLRSGISHGSSENALTRQ